MHRADHHLHSTWVWAVQRQHCLEVCTPPQESAVFGHLQGGGCWESLGVFGSGTEFFLWRWGKGLWHAPMRLSPALWSSCLGGCSYLGKGLFYLFLFLSFSSLFFSFHQHSFCTAISESVLLTPALSLHSFPILPFLWDLQPLFQSHPHSIAYILSCTPLAFSFCTHLLSPTVQTHDRLCN